VSQHRDQAKDQAQAEELAWLIEQAAASQRIDNWTAAFIAGEATIESYPIEDWKRVYFTPRPRKGEEEAIQCILTSTRGTPRSFVRRLIEEFQEESGRPPVPHYRWEAWPSDESPGIEAQDV
jgi:hypothetical protein